MDIQGTIKLMYEVLRTKEDRALMVWEDERQAMAGQIEVLKSENAAQAAIIKRQQTEYDTLMKTMAGFSTISAASSSSSRNFLASIPKPVRQNTSKEAPTSHSKRPREPTADEEPDFISIDRSKSSKKGPMDSFFASGTPAATSSTTNSSGSASTSKAASKGKNKATTKTSNSVQSKLTKANTMMDDSWLYESTYRDTTSNAKRGSGGEVEAAAVADEMEVEANQQANQPANQQSHQQINREVKKEAPREAEQSHTNSNSNRGTISNRREPPATSSSTSTVPVHAVHHQGMQSKPPGAVAVYEDMDTQWLALTGQAATTPSPYKHTTTTTHTKPAPEYITVLDSLDADLPLPLSHNNNIHNDNTSDVDDDDVTVAAPSQENPPLYSLGPSQEVQEHYLEHVECALPRGGEEVRFPDSQATCASQHVGAGSSRYEYGVGDVTNGVGNSANGGNGASGVYKDRRLSLLPASPSQTQSQLYSQEINIQPADDTTTTPAKPTTSTSGNRTTNDEETNIGDDLFMDLEHTTHITNNNPTNTTTTTSTTEPKEHMFVPQQAPKREEIIDLSCSPNKENKRRINRGTSSSTGGIGGDSTVGGVNDKQDVLQDVSNMLPPQSNSVRKSKKATHISANKTMYDTTTDTTHDTTHDTAHANQKTTHTTPYPFRTTYSTTTAASAAANRLVVSFTDLSPEITLPNAVSRGSVGSVGSGACVGGNGDVSAYIDRLVHNNTDSGSKTKNVITSKNSKHDTTNTTNTSNATKGDAQYDLSAITNHPNYPTHPNNTHPITTHPNTTHPNKTHKTRTLLSTKQQRTLTLWLHEYRKKWINYWNYLSNTTVVEMVRTVPVTMTELAAVPGIGVNKAKLYGDGILCTIYAYLESNDLLHLFPHATPPTLPECPTWRDPFSEEADIIRSFMQDNNFGAGGGGARYNYDQDSDGESVGGVGSVGDVGGGVVNKSSSSGAAKGGATSSNATSSSSSGSKKRNTTTNSTIHPTTSNLNTTNPTTTTSTSATTNTTGGAGKGTYNTSKCIETVRSREQRAALPGHTCEECARFYETMQHQGIMCMTDSQMRREVLQACSRHKARWTPPGTPEGFWGLTLHTPDDWK